MSQDKFFASEDPTPDVTSPTSGRTFAFFGILGLSLLGGAAKMLLRSSRSGKSMSTSASATDTKLYTSKAEGTRRGTGISVRLSSKRPQFDEVYGEFIVPIRLSEDMVHNLVGSWHPVGVGYAQLRPRSDGSFDLFIKTSDIDKDMNIVRLDLVQDVLMSALDLTNIIVSEENLVSEETLAAAHELRRQVSAVV